MSRSNSPSTSVVKLVSQIIGQELNPHDVSPAVVFITSVLYVLNGVIFADQSVEVEEKARLEKIIDNLCPKGSQARDLAHIINENIQKQELYQNLNNLDILTEGFSESDKLLLLSLGYEMSMADGSLDKTEKRHLKTIGTFLEIDDKFHGFLESLFVKPDNLDSDILKEFKNLLDPARFHYLDEIFVLAANQVLDQIPGHKSSREIKSLPRNVVESFEQLEEFKVKCNVLEGIFERIKVILDLAQKNSFIPENILKNTENIEKEFEHLREFRIAVIGDFSQGKSTLLNVLVGEEIQPVDISPCSGTITALRFGQEKRAICFYKDGTSEPISFSEYKKKASLDEDAAIGNAIQGLEENKIHKIVVEHPNLLFCKQGVEILDSPGLNEHPKRSEITQQLLQEVDGVIFLTNPLQQMTQSEQSVIDDVISILNLKNNVGHSIRNLFVVVNKWDLTNTKEEQEKVKKRVTTICKNKNIITNDNRIHYLSAQKTLNAILNNNEDEYLESFKNFINALEMFLANEIGDIKIKKISDKIYLLLDSVILSLEESKNILNSQSKNTENEKQEIINQIGEITGRDTKIKMIANTIRDETIEEINDAYDEWLNALPDRLVNHAQNWSSEHGAIMSRDKLIADYVRQFNQDLSNEFNNWITKSLKNRILKRSIREFRQAVKDELKALENETGNLGLSSGDSSDSFNYSFNNYNLEDVGIGSDLLFAGLGLAVGVPLFIFAGPIVAAIGAVLGSSGVFNAAFKAFDLNDTIKGKVFEIGLENFFNSSESTDKINEIVYHLFDNETLVVDNFLKNLIFQYENRIKIIEKKRRENQKENISAIQLLDQNISDLKQINYSLEQI